MFTDGAPKSFLGSRSNRIGIGIGLEFGMLFFAEGGIPENPEKNPQSRDENQQQTQPIHVAESENRTLLPPVLLSFLS